MEDKKSIESRRKLLKSIAAGSGAIIAGKSLPENWTKPVVDSVILPVHAQTSCTLSMSATSTAPYSTSPPGPDVTVGTGGTITTTVTPAPADGEMVLIEAFIDGAFNSSASVPMTGGVASAPFTVTLPGLIELRGTYDCAVTSIYFTAIPAPGPAISGATML